VGTILLLVQFAMTLMGFDSDTDVDVDFDMDGDLDAMDHDSSWYFGILSVKSVIAAVAFFGLGGVAAEEAGFSQYASLLIAIIPAALAMVLVAWLMKMLHNLNSQGNVNIENAMGLTGKVYLTIPGNNSGMGKVTVAVQNRTMEYSAMTAKDELVTGTPVVVVNLIDEGTIEVAPVNDKGE
jgi:membrane protein implicated in regulation of membrane protease activity